MDFTHHANPTLRALAVLAGILLMTAAPASAQRDSTPVRQAGIELAAGSAPSAESPSLDLRQWHLDPAHQSTRVDVEATRPSSLQPTHRAHRSKAARVARRIALGAALGVAGFFGGGILGASLEPDCHCDDPGLRGALIGAPIGATVGVIVGVRLAK
jgi:hypothetical protein